MIKSPPFILRMRHISEEICRKNPNKILRSIIFLIVLLFGAKYCRAGQTTDDNIISRIHIACWTPKAATLTQNMLCLWLFCCNNRCRKAHHCCVIRTFPVLLVLVTFCCCHRIYKFPINQYKFPILLCLWIR
jgi:hypothetical protein